jgi:hypothetical protein
VPASSQADGQEPLSKIGLAIDNYSNACVQMESCLSALIEAVKCSELISCQRALESASSDANVETRQTASAVFDDYAKTELGNDNVPLTGRSPDVRCDADSREKLSLKIAEEKLEKFKNAYKNAVFACSLVLAMVRRLVGDGGLAPKIKRELIEIRSSFQQRCCDLSKENFSYFCKNLSTLKILIERNILLPVNQVLSSSSPDNKRLCTQ